MQYNMKQLNIYLKSKAPIMFTSKKKRERNQMRELMVLTQWVNNWITPLNALNMESEANFISAESTYTFNFSMYLSGPTKTLHTVHVQHMYNHDTGHNHDCLASHCSSSHPFNVDWKH